jgi:rhodanese-related sulfurtransferase
MQIRVTELRDKLAAGEPVYLLDVREPEEHAYCRLPGDTLIPLGELVGRADDVAPPPGVPVVVYCHHGVRSLRAVGFLRSAGHPTAVSLAGGIDAWSRLIDPAVPRY